MAHRRRTGEGFPLLVVLSFVFQLADPFTVR
jgi:hypothetical protein